jgi:glutathione S-transferase
MTMILHEYAASGNCYKIRLAAAHLGIALERREYDILKGETRTADFLATVNGNGRIPVLQDGDMFIPESNAALWYLAEGSAVIPTSRVHRAHMLQWMFFEQYSHEPNIATLRFWLCYHGMYGAQLNDWQKATIPHKRAGGDAALAVMAQHLAANDWFAGDAFSLADIALYAYTHVAGDAGFELHQYPAVQAWLARVSALPGHIVLEA